MKASFEDGKYEVEFDEETGRLTAKRHGEPWREMVGDKLILAMLQRTIELEEKLARCDEEIQEWRKVGEGILGDATAAVSRGKKAGEILTKFAKCKKCRRLAVIGGGGHCAVHEEFK